MVKYWLWLQNTHNIGNSVQLVVGLMTYLVSRSIIELEYICKDTVSALGSQDIQNILVFPFLKFSEH